MPVRHLPLQLGANPGSNVGAAFTASMNETEFSPPGPFLDSFVLSYKGDAAAAVANETFADLVSPFTFKVNGNTRIQLRGRDIYALQAAFLRRLPGGTEATANAEDCRFHGLNIPVWTPNDDKSKFSYSVTRAAVGNIATETLTLIARGKAAPGPGQRPLHIVEITATTAGAAGIQSLVQLPRQGRLLGLLCFLTGSTDINDDEGTWNHLMLDLNDLPWSTVGLDDQSIDLNPAGGTWQSDVLDLYRYVDFMDDPIDLVANKVTLRTDTREASTAVRFIPIIQL